MIEPPFWYVTFDPDGTLTGLMFQVPPSVHAGCHIKVDEPPVPHWTAYRANAARDGLELLPPVVPPAPSEAEIVAGYMAKVQRHLDKTARSWGYDNTLSVVSYADEPSVTRYQQEGIAFRAWRSQVWDACEQILEAYKRGERDAPTYEQLIAELPAPPTKNN